MDNPFHQWLELTLTLQREAFSQDPRQIGQDEELRAEYVLWNAFAACDEIHEAMQEVGWKPWATSRHMNNDAFLGEIVDALHFVGNMILAAAERRDESPYSLATKVWAIYQTKADVNLQRQLEGYDGVKTKCPNCHRELVKRTSDNDPVTVYECPEHGVISIQGIS